MKIVFNDDTNKVIEFTSFERSLNTDIENPNVKFFIYLNSTETENSDSLKFIADYVSVEITGYKLYNNQDELISEEANIHMHVTGFSELINDDLCSAQARFEIIKFV